MLGYKSAKTEDGTIVVITLEIPKDAIVNWERPDIVDTQKAKYRANKVKVLRINDHCGKSYREAVSHYEAPQVVYKIGRYVEVNKYDMVLTNECATGIHFFLDKEAAEHYEIPKQFTGVRHEYYHSGQKYTESNYLYGKLHGMCKEFYDTGEKMRHQLYMNGKLHGPYMLWSKNGDHICTGQSIHGKNHGIVLVYTSNSKNIYESHFKHGTLIREKQYTDGVLDMETYYRNNKLVSEKHYKNGMLVETTSGKKRKRATEGDE